MTEEKPLTREDVLKLIEEHGGPEGLDLSKRNLKGIDLAGEPDQLLDLHGVILYGTHLQGANLSHTNLKGANLEEAKLQHAKIWDANLQGVNLLSANLEKAVLVGSNLHKADLGNANLQGTKCEGIDLRNTILFCADIRGAVMAGADMRGANFLSVEFNRDTDFVNVNWGSKRFAPRWIECVADRTYRELKNWHNEVGMYDIAGGFFYREMTARMNSFWLGESSIIEWTPEKGFLISGKTRSEYFRGNLKPFKPKKLLGVIFPKRPLHWAWSMVIYLLCGYGEKPLRVVIAAGAVILIITGILSASALTFTNALYFSAVSFTALGYGLWVSAPTGWVQGLGAAEAFLGVFMMALFLITFVRKMTR